LPTNGGKQNTAIGDLALQNHSSGNGNTALGYQSMYQDIAGGNNTAVGVSSLSGGTSAHNVAIGYDALGACTGTQNIGIGYFTAGGLSLTSGNYDIDIGAAGVAGETGIIRIGTPGTQTNFIACGDLYTSSNITAALGFTGPGANITGLSASQLTSGTIPTAQLPGALQLLAINNGSGLTNTPCGFIGGYISALSASATEEYNFSGNAVSSTVSQLGAWLAPGNLWLTNFQITTYGVEAGTNFVVYIYTNYGASALSVAFNGVGASAIGMTNSATTHAVYVTNGEPINIVITQSSSPAVGGSACISYTLGYHP